MKKTLQNIGKTLAMPILIFLVLIICVPNFGLETLKLALLQSIIPTVMGYAICFVNAGGMFDLSSGSAVIMAAMVGGGLSAALGLPGLILGCLVCGVVLGIINGAVYSALKIPSLIVSLGLLLIYEILAQKIGFGTYAEVEPSISFLGKYPYNILILLATGMLFYFMYNRTKYSCHLRAVGSEELLAGNMGVNVKKTKFLAFVFAGIFIGIASFLQITYSDSISTVSSLTSISMVFNPLICVMIASVMQSFCNMAFGVFVAQISITMVFNALIALGLPNTMKDVVLGIFLIIVMGISANKKRLGRKNKTDTQDAASAAA